MRTLLVVLAGAAGLYLAIVGALYLGQRKLLFPAWTSRPASAAEASLEGVRDVALATADGERLAAWWTPPRPGRAVIVYFHGNGGGLMERRDRVRALTRDGRGLLMVSYRGYGGSTGSPSEEGFALDARAAHDWVAGGYEAERIVLYGESIGAGVAVRLASERAVGGLVLDAPFTSALDVARSLYAWVPVALLMRDPFLSAARIGAVRAPVLVLHGEGDRVIPFAMGERLFALAPEPKRFVRLPGGHEGNLEAGIEAVRAFLDGVEARMPAPPPRPEEVRP
ncbi:MAG TPA: alpha/beta hydrolase [Salinarimonas sp.]|nr:alpha/beta hydrolase [Salinarimonas sp.]